MIFDFFVDLKLIFLVSELLDLERKLAKHFEERNILSGWIPTINNCNFGVYALTL